MARVLLVGCGCRGRALATALTGEGHVVRGTTRRPASLEVIEAAGAEAVVADPDRLATLLPHLGGVSVLCWLMGTLDEPGAIAALHGPRLGSMLETLVDTHVRGAVYEPPRSGVAIPGHDGREVAARIAATYPMPIEVVEADTGEIDAWLTEAVAAVGRVLASSG